MFISICDADSSMGAGGYAAGGGVTSGADGGGACRNITHDPFIHEKLSWQGTKHICCLLSRLRYGIQMGTLPLIVT